LQKASGMRQIKIQILSTKSLPGSLVETSREKGIAMEVIPFIQTETIESVEVQQEVEHASIKSTTAIFTSKNAVEAVISLLEDQQPDWDIYCIGHATKKSVVDYFGEDKIIATADNAADLAELIVDENSVDEALFFCGNQRRDELPDRLRANDIEVHEIRVYHSVAVPKKITKKYNGIVFFSPSAVDSFFGVNTLPSDTILFAIGNTTANSIKKYSENKIIISKKPDKNDMIRQVINYFN
jgi:uroporphyrinogen-III synthase